MYIILTDHVLQSSIKPINVKLFTMVKDEVDIIKEWILYHGHLFGYNNLFIVDNFSTDGTFEVINSFKNLGVNIFREVDYKQKGYIMTNLIKTYCSNEFGYPIDIDEFIVYYDKTNNTISVDRNTILNYFSNLPIEPVYKTNFILSRITNGIGYENAVVEAVCGVHRNCGNSAKSFFNTTLFTGTIDHGNHYLCDNYYLTDLCIVHYHHRSLNQLKKKIYNNVLGLGYDLNDISQLKQHILKGSAGFHHIISIINILENRYVLPTHEYNSHTDCLLKPLSDLIISLKSL